jgi:hypothetical protein
VTVSKTSISADGKTLTVGNFNKLRDTSWSHKAFKQ